VGPRAAWSFDPAQDHPEPRRGMAVARRGFREHHRRRRGHHCRRAQGRGARRPPRGQRHRTRARSTLGAQGATASGGGTVLGGPHAPNVRDRRVGLSALWPFGVAQGHPEHSRRMAGASG
jgi:hypothetical protein